jgi:hypothetical protein
VQQASGGVGFGFGGCGCVGVGLSGSPKTGRSTNQKQNNEKVEEGLKFELFYAKHGSEILPVASDMPMPFNESINEKRFAQDVIVN